MKNDIYWSVSGYNTTNQIEAWIKSTQLQTCPEFHFYDDAYDSVDWTQEPSESWDELCYQRCLQLRQQYKHLALVYSAGRDSHHILRCFSKFNIPIDELITFKYNPIPNSYYWTRVLEMDNIIMPLMKKYVEQFPKTKITVQDILTPEMFNDYYSDDHTEKKSVTATNGLFTVPLILGLRNIYDSDNEGFIFGLDKPRIILENNKFYSTILDKVIEYYIKGQSSNVEFFYFTPNLPKLHVKQSWTLLNYIITNYSTITHEFLEKFCAGGNSVYYDEFCLGSGRGSAISSNLELSMGKSKISGAGKDPKIQRIIEYAIQNKWQGVHNYLYSAEYLTDKYPQIFNGGDARLGTVGLYAKKRYMKPLDSR